MYRNFSHVKSNQYNSSGPTRKMFPTILHKLLSNAEYNHIVTWLPHGRSFIILDRDEFGLAIAKTDFKLTKVKSFIRQLNGWGFHRVNKGPEKGSYFHELFLRGMPHLAFLMKRPKGFKKEFKIDNPPDFFEISRNNPLPLMHSQAQNSAVVEHDNFSTAERLNSSSTLEALSIQYSRLLLSYHHNEMYLRQLRQKQQLLLSGTNSPLSAIEIRNLNFTGQSVLASLVER